MPRDTEPQRVSQVPDGYQATRSLRKCTVLSHPQVWLVGVTSPQVLHCYSLLVLPPDTSTVENAFSKTHVSIPFPLQELGFPFITCLIEALRATTNATIRSVLEHLEFVSKHTNAVCGRNVIKSRVPFPRLRGCCTFVISAGPALTGGSLFTTLTLSSPSLRCNRVVLYRTNSYLGRCAGYPT